MKSACAPWQNGFVERLIGSIRRECLDHVFVSGEAHLRRILISYADYRNSVRTHRSLHKDARFVVRFNRQESFVRTRSLVDFVTITSESRFSVHTGLARTTTCRSVKFAIVAASELLAADGGQPETQN
jgi:hypothetical protein